MPKQHPIQGIDISKWQGPIDWASVRGAGTQFAFIKATEGGDHVDERFRANWEGAAKAGVPRGAYHFVFWCRSAQDQVEWFKKNVPNDPTALPPVLDVEWNGHSQLCPKKLPKAQALAMMRYMLDEMERYTGKRPIIYTDITFHKDVLEDELLDYPHWVRSTAAEPEQRFAKRKWMLWQFTSTGRVPGVRGDVGPERILRHHRGMGLLPGYGLRSARTQPTFRAGSLQREVGEEPGSRGTCH